MMKCSLKHQIQISEALKRMPNRQKGASAIEYALIVGLIAVAIVGALTFLGDEIAGLFDSIGESIQGASD